MGSAGIMTGSSRMVPFDPRTASREGWSWCHDFRRLRHKETDPEDPLEDDASTEAWMRTANPQEEQLRFAILEDDKCVGWLHVSFYREDSPSYEERKHVISAYPQVLKSHRRRGLGRLMLSKVAELAREHGRDLVIFDSDEEDGMAFLQALGAPVVHRWAENRLRLDSVDWDMVQQWAEEGPSRNPDTGLHLLTGQIPDDVLEDYASVLTETLNQAPRGELAIGDVTITTQTIREWEANIVGNGGQKISAFTQEADDRVSGLTEMGYFPELPTFIRQFMTGVKLEFRGRGLGKWLKAVNLLRVRSEFPQVQVVTTGNATTNAPMLSINDRLGFKLHREGVSAQLPLGELEEYLHSQWG